MPIKSLNPYIIFNGKAAEAIALYERVLDAKPGNVVRAADVPGMAVAADQKHRLVHGVLHIGGTQLMVSDEMSSAPSGGSGNMQVCLDFTDLGEMTRTFAALAEGGAITLPLQDTFWGARFGMLTDMFGVRWMFNCATSTSP
jgi:PhnB protein